jgi:hypothetical protein
MSTKSELLESPNPPNDQGDRNTPTVLPGQPGYRTRDGRTGYDPVDTSTETGRTAGTFIQRLFTGQSRIQNPFTLFLFAAIGLGLILPLFVAIVEMLNGNLFSWDAWIFLLITSIVGLAVLFIFIKNLLRNRT